MRIKILNALNNTEFELDCDPQETCGSLLGRLKADLSLPSSAVLQIGASPLNNALTLSQSGATENCVIKIAKRQAYAYSSFGQTQQHSMVQTPFQREYTIPWQNEKLLSPSAPSTPYFRFSTSAFPANKRMAEEAGVHLGVVVRPADVSNQPVFDYRESTLLKCKKCGCMLCPQISVNTRGDSWICPSCGDVNTIAFNTYNIHNAPELTLPVYDVIVPPFSNSTREGRPCFTFIIDMSAQSFALSFTQQFLYSIRASIPSMPDNTQVNLITISDKLTYFDFAKNTEIVFSDLTDVTLPDSPTPYYLRDVRDTFMLALDTLLTRNDEFNSQGHCFGSALPLAEALMKDGGCIVAGFVGLPVKGPYYLRERKVSPENPEKMVLRLPADSTAKFYRDITFALNRNGISLHVFNAGSQYADLATDAVATGLTGGSCHHYHQFDHENRMKLHNDVFTLLTKQFFWDCSLRVKTSKGIHMKRAHGNCIMKNLNGSGASFPVLMCDDSLVLDFEYEDNVTGSGAFVQMQLYFTTTEGVNMIRVFSFSVPFAQNAAVVRENVDEAALLGIVVRKLTTNILAVGAVEAEAKFLQEMKILMTNGTNLSSFPYFIHSLLASDILAPSHPDGVDGRLSLIIKIRSSDIINLMVYLYPRFFVLTETGEIMNLPLNNSSFAAGSCFVVHMVDKIVVWVSAGATESFLSDVFGVTELNKIKPAVPETGGPIHDVLISLADECRQLSSCYLPLIAIPQGSPSESIFQYILVDELKGYDMTYQEYLQRF